MINNATRITEQIGAMQPESIKSQFLSNQILFSGLYNILKLDYALLSLVHFACAFKDNSPVQQSEIPVTPNTSFKLIWETCFDDSYVIIINQIPNETNFMQANVGTESIQLGIVTLTWKQKQYHHAVVAQVCAYISEMLKI